MNFIKFKKLSIYFVFQVIFITNLFSQSLSGFDSKFMNQSVPDRMSPYQKYNLVITYQNSGSTSWKRGEVKLKIFSDEDKKQSVWTTNEYDIANDIEPGNSLSFIVDITAPAEEGVYKFSSQLTRDGIFFGKPGKEIEISVTREVVRSEGFNSAAFVEQTVPAVMDIGKPYKIMISYTNTGSTSWQSESYKLVMLDASGNAMTGTKWQNLSVGLDEDIKPGSSKVFNFEIVPFEAGTYTLQWRMSSTKTGFFGDVTNPAVVTVKPIVVKKNEGKRGKE